MFHQFVELERCGLPKGNLTKIQQINTHTCALIRIRNVDVKAELTKTTETLLARAVAEYKMTNS
jgi:hypothetical protein